MNDNDKAVLTDEAVKAMLASHLDQHPTEEDTSRVWVFATVNLLMLGLLVTGIAGLFYAEGWVQTAMALFFTILGFAGLWKPKA